MFTYFSVRVFYLLLFKQNKDPQHACCSGLSLAIYLGFTNMVSGNNETQSDLHKFWTPDHHIHMSSSPNCCHKSESIQL